MRAKDFIPASKPRNFVAKNQKTAGAGAHRDKKKEQKQGYEKHKGKGVAEGFFGIDDKIKGKIQNIVSDLSDIPGMWDHKAQTFTDAGMDKLKVVLKNNPKHIKYAVNLKTDDYDESINIERVRDPEDWDEGNTEPPNNFAIYINGKKWKVFAGRGYYADDEREMKQYYDLKAWAARKSEATGRKWEVSKTGEPATESIKEDTDIPFDQCPHCAGPIFHESLMMEKQDACYHKVKSRYKVWPSAYASGALVRCRKKGAKNWGNKSK